MADVATTPAAAAEKIATPKKGKAAKTKKPRVVPSHPKTSDMVSAAITSLKERGGSSLQAIKKYIASTYKVDVEKLSPFIKKYLKSAVTSGALVQTKGKGASGSFKLSTAGKAEKKAAKKKVAKKPKSATKPAAKKTGEGKKKPAAKKSPKKKKAAKPARKTGEKKKAAAPKPKKVKSPKKEKKPKSPKKPKPKKAAAKKATPKK